jgi:predicted peroxiredoxin
MHRPQVYGRGTRAVPRRAVPGAVGLPRPARTAKVSAMPERSAHSGAHSRLVIKVTAGKDDPERCNQAFTVAATAAASGVPVSLWLTGESAWFGLPGRAEDFSLPQAAPLADLLAGVLAAGSVTVCTQCAARRNIEPGDLIDGIRIAGAATFVAEVMTEGAQALVY